MIFYKECIIKNLFHKCKSPISIDKVDIKKIVLSSKESYGNKGVFKYFIGYISNAGIVPLYIKLPQMNAKYFDSNNKYMKFVVCHKQLLKKFNAIWDKICNLFQKESNSEPVYGNKFLW